MSPLDDKFPAQIGGYALPNCHTTAEDRDRLHQRDVPAMSDEDLRVERLRIQPAYVAAFGQRIYVHTSGLELYISAQEWLRCRRDALDAEALRRRGRRSA